MYVEFLNSTELQKKGIVQTLFDRSVTTMSPCKGIMYMFHKPMHLCFEAECTKEQARKTILRCNVELRS